MIKLLAFIALLALPIAAVSAQQVCLCTAGCTIAADAVAGGAANSPTSCTVYKGGVSIGTGAVVASSTIALSNAARCTPASTTYVPGPASNVACSVAIPAQAAGNVTITMTASNAAGETAQSSPFVFVSAAALPTLPAVPLNLRVAALSAGPLARNAFAYLLRSTTDSLHPFPVLG